MSLVAVSKATSVVVEDEGSIRLRLCSSILVDVELSLDLDTLVIPVKTSKGVA